MFNAKRGKILENVFFFFTCHELKTVVVQSCKLFTCICQKVGLAVGDIDKIQENARMDRYVLQVSQVIKQSLHFLLFYARPHMLASHCRSIMMH